MYKILIVDDHPFIRSAVRIIFEQENFEVVGESENGSDAIQLARELLPDIILLDIAMPNLDGLEVIERITEMRLPIKTLILSSQSARFYSPRCMKAGASGYICKTDNLSELVKAVNIVMSGYTYFPALPFSSVRSHDTQLSEAELIDKLSNREVIILQQLAMGFTNKEISEAMLLSNKTISTYKTRLSEKLNVKSVVHLAELAKRNNLV